MIGVIGISFKSAPVELREKFVLNDKEKNTLLEILVGEKDFNGLVILSTCNRTEIYYNQTKSCSESKFQFLLGKLCKLKNQDPKEHQKYFYTYTDVKCVKHLFSVSSGIDSLVLGEDQIIGQVKEAYRISNEKQLSGAVFNRLFHKAFEAGKKVRTMTAINQGISSVSSAAVELASREMNDFSSKSVLLIGAGETGQLVLQNMLKKGIRNIYIANRTLEKTRQLSEKFHANTVPFEAISDYYLKTDIIVASTASDIPIITYSDIETAMPARTSPLFLFDLSMPRNIEDRVKNINNVFLYTMDHLIEMVSVNYEKRKAEVEKAQKIIDSITSEFFEWMSTLSLIPTIDLLNKKFDMVVDRRLHFIKNKVDAKEYGIIEKSSHYLKDKYVRLIVNNLKKLSDNGRKPEYINMINQLLELTKLDKT